MNWFLTRIWHAGTAIAQLIVTNLICAAFWSRGIWIFRSLSILQIYQTDRLLKLICLMLGYLAVMMDRQTIFKFFNHRPDCSKVKPCGKLPFLLMNRKVFAYLMQNNHFCFTAPWIELTLSVCIVFNFPDVVPFWCLPTVYFSNNLEIFFWQKRQVALNITDFDTWNVN